MRHHCCRQAGDTLGAPRINPHWARDVLDALLPHVLEGAIELVAHLVAHYPADADPAWLGQGFQTRCDIDPVAEDIVVLYNHVAQVDADAEPNPALFGHVEPALGHPALDLHCTAYGIHHARKLCQEPVARVLHDPAAVFGDLGVDQFPEVGLEPFVRPFLVGAHQPRIRNYVGGEDRG